ncbi:hypothetical protein M422DRAFT_277098 [Sphaerobolus stellatus SS14]|uniref:Uncharacterized protein n=1 Tax=Sphaerobolus stellatus (strain SS14) TaxID=990650 RepID=A0A0C9T161_SPHS4|nr:hypothetical protein M422DRAFT_277098 [Sphaerobolus stellatus SS14]
MEMEMGGGVEMRIEETKAQDEKKQSDGLKWESERLAAEEGGYMVDGNVGMEEELVVAIVEEGVVVVEVLVEDIETAEVLVEDTDSAANTGGYRELSGPNIR